jgi:opacity protein-like surface antigen
MKIKAIFSLLVLSFFAQNSAMAEEQLFNRFYVGAGVNAGWTQFDALHDSSELREEDPDPEDAEYINKNWDFSGGGYAQIGKDWQLNNSWVAGVVFDYNHLNNKVTGREPSTPAAEYITFDSDYMMTLRGKLGYLLTDRTLVYGTAGVANYKTKFTNYNDLNSDAEVGSKSFRSTDFVVGAGITWFTPYSDKVSVNVEALYYTGGKKEKFSQNQLSDDTDVGDYAEVKKSALVKIGLNYSF